jgi:hypothetical protein
MNLVDATPKKKLLNHNSHDSSNKAHIHRPSSHTSVAHVHLNSTTKTYPRAEKKEDNTRKSSSKAHI